MRWTAFEWIAQGSYLASLSSLVLTCCAPQRHRRYPCFAAYIVILWAQDLGLVIAALEHSAFAYYWLYIGSQTAAAAVLLAVLYEVFRDVFAPSGTLPRHSIGVLFAMGAITLALALELFAAAHSPSNLNPYLAARERIDGAINLTALVGFSFVALFSDYFGIPWRAWVFGIGFGMLIGTGADAAVSFLPQRPSVFAAHTLMWAGVAYMWQRFLERPDSPRLVLSGSDREQLDASVRKHCNHVKHSADRAIGLNEAGTNDPS